MQTYKEIVNSVLRRLRKDTITNVSDTSYSLMIGEFVKQATREVENAWNWNALRTTVQVTTAADDYSYVLTGAGHEFRILDVFNNTEDCFLRKSPSYSWMNARLLEDDLQTGDPEWYDVNGIDSNGDPIVNLWPVPDGVFKVNFNLVTKTVYSADTDYSPLYELPIILRATMHAIEERGDDGGLSLQYLQDQYTKALGDAIAYDAYLNEDETVWRVE